MIPLLLILLLAGSCFAANWTIDGDRVYWSENGGTISASPHTIRPGQYQYVNFSYPNTATVNLSFVLDDRPNGGGIEVWRNGTRSRQVESIGRAQGQVIVANVTGFAATTSNNCAVGDATNTYKHIVNTTSTTNVVYCFDSYIQNGTTYTLTYSNNATFYSTEQYTGEGWDKVNLQYTSIAGKHIYTANNVQFPGFYQTRFSLDMPPNTNGKYDIYAHRGSPSQAVADRSLIYFMLDPWYNASYASRRLVNCTNTEAGMPYLVNGSGGFSFNGTAQKVYVPCQANLYLYYNTDADWMFANDTAQVPHVTYSGNRTSYLPAQAFNSRYVGAWPLNETSGTTAYDIFGYANGNIVTNVSVNNAGPVSKAYRFGGSSSRVNISYYPQLNTTNFTLQMWVRMAAQTNKGIINKGTLSSTQGDWAVIDDITSYERQTFRNDGAGANDALSRNRTVVDNGWHLVHWTYNPGSGGNKSIYFDGRYQNSSAGAATAVTATNIWLGCYYSTSYCYVGYMADVRVLNYTMTPTQISAEYQNYLATPGYATLEAAEAVPSSPVLSSVTILPVNATNIDNITCQVNYTSILVSSMNISYEWYLNGTNQTALAGTYTGYTNNTLTNISTIAPGTLSQNWSCRVRATDGTQYSEWNMSSNMTILAAIVFRNATPADINFFNVIGTPLNSTYNITAPTLNTSSPIMYYKVNDSTSACLIYVNGSTTCSSDNNYYIAMAMTSGVAPVYYANLYETMLLPASYNLPERGMEMTIHTGTSLASPNQLVAIEILNVSNTTPFSIFEVMANTTTANPIRVYYANSSYDFSTTITSSPNAAEFCQIPAQPYNHTHSAYSSHMVCPFGNGSVNGVAITPTSYFILSGALTGTSQYWYITNTTRAGATRISANGGGIWLNQTYTVDAHIHQAKNTTTYYEYACANSTTGYGNCTSVRSDLMELGGLPPIIGITSPANTTYDNSLWVNYTYFSPNAYAMNKANITLWSTTPSFLSTIVGNNSPNLSYLYNTTTLANGQYLIGVNATDTAGQATFEFSKVFTIYHNLTPVNLSMNFTNASAGHWFLVTGRADYAYGGSNITDTNITSTSGTCGLLSSSVNATSRADTYNCSGTAFQSANITIGFETADGTYAAVSGSNSYPNQAPTAPPTCEISLPIGTAYKTSNFTAFTTGSTDPDEDTITYFYQWSLNDSTLLQSYATANPYDQCNSNPSCQPNLTLILECKAKDGFNFSDASLENGTKNISEAPVAPIIVPVTILYPANNSVVPGGQNITLQWTNYTSDDSLFNISFQACLFNTYNSVTLCIITSQHNASYYVYNASVVSWTVLSYNSTDNATTGTHLFYGGNSTYVTPTINVVSFPQIIGNFWNAYGPWLLMLIASGVAYLTMPLNSTIAMALSITAVGVGLIFGQGVFFSIGVALLIIGAVLKVAGR